MRTLTAAQASAIRLATAVCFDQTGPDGQIRAINRGKDSKHERTDVIVLPDGSCRIDSYGPHPSSPEGGDYRHWTYSCFAMVMCAQSDNEWRTVARQIKAGSQIGLRWVRGNSSPVTDEAGLVVDHLTVVVQNGAVGNHYRVATYVGLDNSARMVRVSRVPVKSLT